VPDGERPDRERLERDFLSEAEEIFDRVGEQLRRLEGARAGGAPPAGAVNALFREVHSLKALAGTLAAHDLTDLAHDLEELLDRMRSRDEVLDATVLDLLHAALDALIALTRRLAQGGDPPAGLSSLRERLRAGGGAAPAAAGSDPLAALGLEPPIRAALSNFEERRLGEIVRSGRGLLRVRLRLEPRGFDAALRAAVATLGHHGEVVCSVPAFGEGPDDPIRFTLLLAGDADPAPVAAALAVHGPEVTIARRPGPAAAPAGPGGSAGGPGIAGEPGAEEIRGVSSSIRIPSARLDDVLAQVADLSIAVAAAAGAARAVREAHPGDRVVSELDRQVRALGNRLRSLQRSTIGARLVPLEQAFARIARMVARLARDSGKEAGLHTLGGETELDKAMMDEIGGPLLHLLRNALDHGIEAPSERAAAGKLARGRLVLSAFQKGNQVVIDVIDDGRGIDLGAVRAAAEAAGRIRPGAALSAEEACELIFAPGFSTARRVSAVSGRGVGLDVVRLAIRRLKGRIEARSVPGRGTTFSITVPITLALVQALIVRAGGARFAIPLSAIRENLRLEDSRLRRVGDGEVYDRPQGPLPLLRLESLAPGSVATAPGARRYAVVAGPPGRPFGMVVDAFLGQQEVVIKPIGRRIRDLPGLAGATDLGDATAVLVLDPESLPEGGGDGAPGV
jgi:two-component system chemotaxis sensor kinase CheA